MLVSGHSGMVLELDVGTAEVSVVAEFSGTVRPTSTDVLGETSLLYSQWDDTLRAFDACTGELDTIGHTGMDHSGGISFGPEGRLFALDDGRDELVELHLETGQATVIGALGIDVGRCGMAYDCASDTLWGLDADTGRLFVIDVDTGAARWGRRTWLQFDFVGLEWWAEEQKLLATTGTELFEIDPLTGLPSRIGSLAPYENINDLVFHQTCRR